MKTEEEIMEVLDRVKEQVDTGGSRYRGMTYEDGIVTALEWLLPDYETDEEDMDWPFKPEQAQ